MRDRYQACRCARGGWVRYEIPNDLARRLVNREADLEVAEGIRDFEEERGQDLD